MFRSFSQRNYSSTFKLYRKDHKSYHLSDVIQYRGKKSFLNNNLKTNSSLRLNHSTTKTSNTSHDFQLLYISSQSDLNQKTNNEISHSMTTPQFIHINEQKTSQNDSKQNSDSILCFVPRKKYSIYQVASTLTRKFIPNKKTMARTSLFEFCNIVESSMFILVAQTLIYPSLWPVLIPGVLASLYNTQGQKKFLEWSYQQTEKKDNFNQEEQFQNSSVKNDDNISTNFQDNNKDQSIRQFNSPKELPKNLQNLIQEQRRFQESSAWAAVTVDGVKGVTALSSVLAFMWLNPFAMVISATLLIMTVSTMIISRILFRRNENKAHDSIIDQIHNCVQLKDQKEKENIKNLNVNSIEENHDKSILSDGILYNTSFGAQGFLIFSHLLSIPTGVPFTTVGVALCAAGVWSYGSVRFRNAVLTWRQHRRALFN